MQNADWVAFLVAAYSRQGGIEPILSHYMAFPPNYGAIVEIQRTLEDLSLLQWKLLKSHHMYSGIFKMSLIARLLAEIGIVPSQYKKTTEKLMWGSGIAAITLPGSGPSNSRSRSKVGGDPYRQELY